MYQYTTPLVILRLSKVDFNKVIAFRVSIQNEDYYYTVKEYLPNNSAVNASRHTIDVRLTQEETVEMKPGLVSIQLRVLFESGNVYASKPYDIAFKPVQDKVILALEEEDHSNEK